MTGGVCGMWSLSPMSNCNVCSPGLSVISVSVWPAPKWRWLKSFGIGLLRAGSSVSTNKW